jgi:uncharacterized protein (TIGR02466 family)
MKIDSWFNSPIALFKNEKFDLTDHCLNMKDKYPITGQHEKQSWIHGPYNSLLILENETTYNSLNDPKFFELTRWIQKCVDEFSEEYGYHKMWPINMWFNVYEKGDSQEFHCHGPHHLSCIYYADVKKDDSRIIFNRNPWPMVQMPVERPCPVNFDQVWYTPERGMLLVFKSDMMHMVERKVTDDIRISFSYNFMYSPETL